MTISKRKEQLSLFGQLTNANHMSTLHMVEETRSDMALIPLEVTNPYVYFASGSSRVGDVRGFHQAGIDVGVTAGELLSTKEGAIRSCEEALYELAGTGRRVFVDSGAYSEVDFDENGPYTVAPIFDEDWRQILDLYERLAKRLGGQLFIVAPDKVAHQWETLDRLEAYAERVRRCREFGANIIVPHQKGQIPLVEFHCYAVEFLGFDDFVCAFPMQKDATSVQDIRDFCAEVKPARVHLLGIGPKSRGSKFSLTLRAIESVSPNTQIFCDSVAIAGAAVRNGKNGPREYVITFDNVAEEACEAAWSEGVDGVGDYTDNVVEEIDSWLPIAKRRDLIKELSELFGVPVPRGAANHAREWL